jgi:hypothetical protein
MLSNTLNTNEVKNSGGTEMEFQRISQSERATEYALITESPAYPHRLNIKHTETGQGVARRRRSVVRFDLTEEGEIDDTKSMVTSAYIVLDAPIGNMSSNTPMKTVIANLLSFCASLGASTTILYDNTGNGAVCLTTGGL